MNNTEIVNPIEDPAWDERVLQFSQTSLFHSAEWAKVLCETYRYEPVYFNGKGEAGRFIWPCMQVRGFAGGLRGVALPFTDFCEPLCEGSGRTSSLPSAMIDAGRHRRWRSLEFRGGESLLGKHTAAATYLHHVLALSVGEPGLWKELRNSVRRAIRKAERSGLEIVGDVSWPCMAEFCYLNALTRKRHGLPPQPTAFFKNVQQQILATGKGMVVLARKAGRPLAGAVFFTFGSQVLFKYGASDRRFQGLRANDLVMWHAIRTFARRDFTSLSLGRTSPLNQGLRRFKLGWGAQEDSIRYFRFDFRQNAFVRSPDNVRGWHNAIFRILPLPLSRMIGSILYRYAA